MPFQGRPIHLTAAQRTDLEEVTRSPAFPAEFVQRAKVVLLLGTCWRAAIFTSTTDLARKLRRYIAAYAKQAKPFRWKYSDSTRRIEHGKRASRTVH